MNWETQRHDGAGLRPAADRYYPDDGGLTVEPINIALLGSVTINAILLWALIETRRNTHYYRELFDHWARRADYWRTLFDDLRRNSVQRDPRTGRYVKGYRRND